MGIISFEIVIGKRIHQLRKEGLIDKQQTPGLIKGFFGNFSYMITNDEQRKLVGRMLDEKAENRIDSKTVIPF